MIGRIYHLTPADMGQLRQWQLDALIDDLKGLAN